MGTGLLPGQLGYAENLTPGAPAAPLANDPQTRVVFVVGSQGIGSLFSGFNRAAQRFSQRPAKAAQAGGVAARRGRKKRIPKICPLMNQV